MCSDFVFFANKYVTIRIVFQDIERLYPEEKNIVKVTLIEANQILSSFDDKLRRYAERKIKQRSQMDLLQGAVVGMYIYF